MKDQDTYFSSMIFWGKVYSKVEVVKLIFLPGKLSGCVLVMVMDRIKDPKILVSFDFDVYLFVVKK